MTQTVPPKSLAAQAQRIGLRALTKVGGLPVMNRSEVRSRVERALYASSRHGFRLADAAARRSYPVMPGSGDPTRAAVSKPGRLFDLNPTEDQAMLRDAARELAEEVIRPAAAQADTDRAVPDTVRKAATEMGLVLVGVPAELDGIAEERSSVATCLVMEQLARGDMGIAAALMAPAAVAAALSAYGSAVQQATYLPAFTGDNPPAYAALAMMEPQPLFDPLQPRTTGVARGDDLVLNGVKALVPGAAESELIIVSAMVGGAPRLVIVEPRTPGLSVQDDPAMGLRAARTGRVVLTDAVVPAANLLGGTADHLDAVRRGRLAWAAMACGTAQAVLDQLIPYVNERKAFGEAIGRRQAVAFTIADIAVELDALRLVTWRAAARLDHGLDAAPLIGNARALTARHGAWIGSSAVQMLGGHGFVKEFDNERWFRDLRGAGLLEGALLA
ncbi:MAG: acyl-CoA dehydrogenase family protein [Nostocoides sp.]